MDQAPAIRCFHCGYELQPGKPIQVCPECGLENDMLTERRKPLRVLPMPRWWVFALRLSWPGPLCLLVLLLGGFLNESLVGCWALVAGLFLLCYPLLVTLDCVNRRFPERERWVAALRWGALAYAGTVFGTIACLVVAFGIAALFA